MFRYTTPWSNPGLSGGNNLFGHDIYYVTQGSYASHHHRSLWIRLLLLLGLLRAVPWSRFLHLLLKCYFLQGALCYFTVWRCFLHYWAWQVVHSVTRIIVTININAIPFYFDVLSFRPTHYSLKHYSSYDLEALRDWSSSFVVKFIIFLFNFLFSVRVIFYCFVGNYSVPMTGKSGSHLWCVWIDFC